MPTSDKPDLEKYLGEKENTKRAFKPNEMAPSTNV